MGTTEQGAEPDVDPTNPPSPGATDERTARGPAWWFVLAVGVIAAIAVVVLVVVGRSGNGGGDEGPSPLANVPRGTVDSVTLTPDQPVQPQVDAHPAGTTFTFEPGVYREQRITPRDGDVFVGSPGAVLNGARVLKGWEADGSGWSVGGQDQEGEVHGRCRDTSPRCDRPEELFVDGDRLTHVESLDQVDATSWWFDYDADRIHIGVDPAGHTVETSTTPFAIQGEAVAVTVRDLTVTHYATPAQDGAISANGSDWVIEGVTAVDNHAVGIIFTGDRAVVRDSVSRGNGQMGMGGTRAWDARVERVELADNNQIGFNDEWEGGGAKFTVTRNMVFTDSYVHGNDGAGIWFDESVRDTTITGNRSIDNTGAGIFYEISQDATISGNTVTGNGFGEEATGWIWGAGIQIAASSGIVVVDNEVADNREAVMIIQQDRGSGRYGKHVADDITIERNTIDPGSGLIGAASDVGGALYDRNIVFRDNTYLVPEGAKAFFWGGDEIDLAAWTALGFS